MQTFRIAFTGDLLNEDGVPTGDVGLGLLADVPYVKYYFLTELAPSRDDPTYWDRFYSLEITPAHIANVHGLFVVRPWLKRSAFADGAANLTAIGRSGAGYDKIDVQACTDNDVLLFNAPDALAHSTATSALMFMLALSKRLMDQERITRQARWDLQARYKGIELDGRTLGIVGLGRSGRDLVRLVAPFHMNVIAYSPHADPAEAAELNVRLTTLEEVFQTSDFVSLHNSLRPDTHRMIRAEHLALMKPTAYLINVARGELIDQPALVTALRERWFAGAGLDVYEHEPLPAGDPLLSLDNVILTPHWSPATSDTGVKTSTMTVNGLLRVARGELPDNIINREVLDRPGFQAKLARFAENR
ncbi:MAG: dehydrogenase [Anaerolineae bacterium]|nr:dehydrogenase [Anaerolineae bacterium]